MCYFSLDTIRFSSWSLVFKSSYMMCAGMDFWLYLLELIQFFEYVAFYVLPNLIPFLILFRQIILDIFSIYFKNSKCY